MNEDIQTKLIEFQFTDTPFLLLFHTGLIWTHLPPICPIPLFLPLRILPLDEDKAFLFRKIVTNTEEMAEHERVINSLASNFPSIDGLTPTTMIDGGKTYYGRTLVKLGVVPNSRIGTPPDDKYVWRQRVYEATVYFSTTRVVNYPGDSRVEVYGTKITVTKNGRVFVPRFPHITISSRILRHLNFNAIREPFPIKE